MVMQSSRLTIPGTVLPMIAEHASKSVVAQLSQEKPTLFGPVSAGTFSGVAKAQVVGEGQPKASQDLSVGSLRAEPLKIQTTVRMTDEFKWADADWRLGMIQDVVVPALGVSMSRAIDILAIHGVNPMTGQVTDKVKNPLNATTNVATMGTSATAADEAIRTAAGLVIGAGGTPNGIAADSTLGFTLANQREVDGRLRYPSLGFGQGMTDFMGMAMASGSTVAGLPELPADSKIRAIVGDWSALRWGFQRDLPMELIEYGDPDQSGRDLQAHNEVALRVEAVLYFLNTAPSRFSLIKAA